MERGEKEATFDEEEDMPLVRDHKGGRAGLRGFFRRQLAGWWSWYLMIDWAILVVTLAIEVPIVMMSDPYDRHLPTNDPSLSYPLLPDTVRGLIFYFTHLLFLSFHFF